MRNTFKDLASKVTGQKEPVSKAPGQAAPNEAFDPAFYRITNPELKTKSDGEVWEHFLREGWKRNRDPSAEFSVSLYLANAGDVAQSNANPFTHYLTAGRAEGRPTFLSTWDDPQAPQVPAALLDRAFGEIDAAHLRKQVPVPFVTLSDRCLAAYYLTTGWRRGIDPSQAFSTSFYLDSNPDVAAAGLNPLLHFVMGGRDEGRVPLPPAATGTPQDDIPTTPDEGLLALFDADYYIGQFDTDAPAPEAALTHYLESGWKTGRDPSAAFSTHGYLEAYPDVNRHGFNPLLHYVRSGRDEGRAPVTVEEAGAPPPLEEGLDLAQSKRLQREIEVLEPHFDPDFYRTSHFDPEATATQMLAHYIRFGWREGRDPSPFFSTSYYLDTYPDVANANVNPLLHYVQFGEAERRLTSPDDFEGDDGPTKATAAEAAAPQPEPEPETPAEPEPAAEPEAPAEPTQLELEMAKAAPYFDAEFYRTRYRDMSGPDEALLMHFMLYGWKEGRDPTPDFATSFYLETNTDVARSGANPFLHYIESGREEGRASKPAHPRHPEVPDGDIKTILDHFDTAYYRAMNEDIATMSDDELLLHFMTVGWRERRDPHPQFSTGFYLDNYPDIAAGGINPYLHYVLFGKSEGRKPRGNQPIRMIRNPEAELTPLHLASIMREPDAAAARIRPPRKVKADRLDIHWVIPDFSRGSGGHMTIFRTIRFLENFGHRCKIWIETPVFHETGLEAWEEIVKYFQCVEAEVDFVENGFFETKGDAVVATGWSTAFLVHRAKGFAGKFYFVQDHEPEFYPTGTERLMAQQTYSFDLACICASPWLDKIMSETYGLWARHFFLAYDHDQYRILDKRTHNARFHKKQSGPCKIAVYARDHTARRCVYLALMAFEKLGAERQDFEVHFYGQDDLPFSETNFPAMNHGVLDADALAALYNTCHFGVCFSATNYSLVPQEMMACGLPLLELDGESTRAIFPPDVVTLGGPDPVDLAKKIAHMIDHPSARKAQAEAALAWVGEFSWESSARVVEAAIRERLDESGKLEAPKVQRKRDTRLDVVIPTWNGLGEVEAVLDSLAAQRDAEHIQVHCIDSSSSDGTIDYLKGRKEVSLTVIDQKDFQHGRTRNFGASLGKAPIIAFLTQDAIPTTATWGTDILKMFGHVPEAAGLFGRHAPYPDHPEYVREEIEKHFANMLKHPLVLSKHTDPERWDSGDQGWRQLLHFYSDNNSAMRRDVWKDFPYAEIDYGEDQVWARDIIEAGYSKVYAPSACVLHSHDYTPVQTYKRSKTEGAFFYTFFGYELGLGTEQEIAQRIKREQANFRAWAKKRDVGPEELEMRQANIAEKYRGWIDGRLEAMVDETALNRSTLAMNDPAPDARKPARSAEAS